MTVAPRSGAAPPLDIAETIERARAAWRAGRADEAEIACRQVLAVWPGQADASKTPRATARARQSAAKAPMRAKVAGAGSMSGRVPIDKAKTMSPSNGV